MRRASPPDYFWDSFDGRSFNIPLCLTLPSHIRIAFSGKRKGLRLTKVPIRIRDHHITDHIHRRERISQNRNRRRHTPCPPPNSYHSEIRDKRVYKITATLSFPPSYSLFPLLHYSSLASLFTFSMSSPLPSTSSLSQLLRKVLLVQPPTENSSLNLLHSFLVTLVFRLPLSTLSRF